MFDTNIQHNNVNDLRCKIFLIFSPKTGRAENNSLFSRLRILQHEIQQNRQKAIRREQKELH